METKKKTWEKPQLIILAQGMPEESVLVACKSIGALAGPAVVNQTACNMTSGTCQNCQSRGGGS
jgi:hypothetical protein